MGKLLPFPPSRSPRTDEPTPVEPELWPVGLLLFVASLARVAQTLWRHSVFDTEPTLALLFVVGLPWLVVRGRWKRR